MRIDAKVLLQDAKMQGSAIPAFNVSSIEALQAVFEAASESESPVIIETSMGESEHLTPEFLFDICNFLAGRYAVDFVLHMDRCKDLVWMTRVLEAGYNSISAEFGVSNWEENLKLSLDARNLTNQYNAQLEGVMEVVPIVYYKRQKLEVLTCPKLAVEFVERVVPDSLVVSIGNQSGRYKTKNALNISLLDKINCVLPQMPLVLHGGSFLDKGDIQKAVKSGVAKINVNSELRIAYTERLKQNIEHNSDEYAPYRLLKGVRQDMKVVARRKIKLFNSFIKV